MTTSEATTRSTVNTELPGPTLVAMAMLCDALSMAGGQEEGLPRTTFEQQMKPWGSDAAELVLKGGGPFFQASSTHVMTSASGQAMLTTLLEQPKVTQLIQERTQRMVPRKQRH